MKLAFIFDTRFIKYKDHYYSVNLTENMWNQRYLKVFESVVVIGRYVEVQDDPSGRYVQSDMKNVEFRCIKDRSKVRRILSQKTERNFIASQLADCDAAICRTWWGVSECIKQNKPYLMEVVNCIWDSYWNHGVLGKIVAVPNYFLQRKAIRTAPYVIYVTKEFLQRRYPTNGKSAGISDVLITENISGETLDYRKKKIEGLKDNIVLGTAAAVNVPYKGQRFVIEAIADLCKQGDCRFEYRLAGSGDSTELKKKAKQLNVEERIDFCGPIPHEKMDEWRNSIDVYIQPSFTEGLPRAVVEAMSLGLPCIGSDCGGIPELIEAPYICKRKNNLSLQISELLHNITKEELLHMAERNFSFARQFSGDLLNQQRLEFLNKFKDYCEGN